MFKLDYFGRNQIEKKVQGVTSKIHVYALGRCVYTIFIYSKAFKSIKIIYFNIYF